MDSTVEDSINTSNASIGSSSTDIGDQGENNTVSPESSPASKFLYAQANRDIRI